MDREGFGRLNNLAKLTYVSQKLEEARSLMQVIYDNCGPAVTAEVLLELESLGDDFVRFGAEAEDGGFEGVFDGINACVGRLEAIAADVRRSMAN